MDEIARVLKKHLLVKSKTVKRGHWRPSLLNQLDWKLTHTAYQPTDLEQFFALEQPFQV